MELDNTKYGLLTGANAATYYAGGSSVHSFSATRPEIGNYADWMGEVAAEYDDVILVEQYDSMSGLFTDAPYMIPILFNSSDYLHPTTEGQKWMLDRFLEETGLTHDGYVANLWYETGTVTEISDAGLPVEFADGTATLDTAALEAACGESLYTVKLLATDAQGTVYSVEGASGENLIMRNLPDGVTFTAEAQAASRNALLKFGVPEVIEVEVYVNRQQTVTLEGDLTPNASGVAGIAAVEASTGIMVATGNDNTFSEGHEPLTDNLYTFDRQDDGTWLIHADVNGTTLYVDPHAGAGNGGIPSRDYQTFITLEDGANGTVRLHEMNGGYLHFWDNDDSKLYWDQCTADGGKYLIVGKANSGGCYALRPSLSTGSKYQHICKVAGPMTALTITGIREGTGTVTAGNYILQVTVLPTDAITITLDYNYDGAPANGTVSGQPFPVTDASGSAYCYRIPGIVTLADGTVVAMADARWNTWADCGGLDTILSVSNDNGKTWQYTYANYLGDNGDIYNP